MGTLAEQGAGHLGSQIGGAGAGDADAGDQHPTGVTFGRAVTAGEELGELATDRVVDVFHPDAERGRVTEQHQAQRGSAGRADRGTQCEPQLRLGVPPVAGQ